VTPGARPEPIHLRPATELAERVLLPGDPHRALTVAQALLEGPKMFNHNRGLWGYTGIAPDEQPLTVQSTGMGGPSAAIVVEELIALGARRLVRIGTCGALTGDFELGELVTAERVLAADGTSRALGAGDVLSPDGDLTDALAGAGARLVTAVTSDLFYDERPPGRWTKAGAEVVEMEAASLLATAQRRGVRAAVLLAVSDILAGEPRRIERDALESAGLRLGEAAYDALRSEV
jgi:uridine phosphorylase